MTLAYPSWSSSHISKASRPPAVSSTPPATKRRKMPPQLPKTPTAMPLTDDLGASSSRSSSLAGKKRPREFDGESRSRPRRTKSVDNTSEGKTAKDREAFQRGLIAVFVPNALRESIAGNNVHYHELLSHFIPTPTTPVPSLPTLLPLLRALSAHVSLLDHTLHSGLVTAILQLPWATGDDKYVKAFVGFAGVLVSAHPPWTKEVVGMAAAGLAWQRPMASTTIPTTRRTWYARHHLLLSHLISLIPTLPNVLAPILTRKFPHKREQEVVQTAWVRNCSELIAYCPELGQRIWSEIVDRMLRIDSEIANIQEDEDEDDSDDDNDLLAGPNSTSVSTSLDPFDLATDQDLPIDPSSPRNRTGEAEDSENESDLDPDELSSAGGYPSDEEEEPSDLEKLAAQRVKRRDTARSMRAKLDGMLHYFFGHLEECMSARDTNHLLVGLASQALAGGSSGRSTPSSEAPIPSPAASILASRAAPTPEECLSYFQTLLSLFSRQILPTASTQHIPFLLFLCSSFTPAHTDLLLGLLVSQSLYGRSVTTPSAAAQPISLNQRVAATVYIGSIVCRARFVTDEQARQVIAYLLAYVNGKLQQAWSGPMKAIEELPLFYAACQAVMLIFCFRWRAFTADKESDSMVGDLELEGDGVEDGDNSGDGKWISDLDILQRVLTSELNPLLGCNATIVSTFAKVAHQTGFAYCFSIIEANQQVAHHFGRSTSSNSINRPNDTRQIGSRKNSQFSGNPSQTVPRAARQFNIDAGFDSYFPFDPYTLPRSKRFIEPLYRTWDDVAIDAADATSDDSDDETGDDESVSVASHGEETLVSNHTIPKAVNGPFGEARRRFLTKDGGLSSSLEGMSISPGVKRR